MSFKNFSLSYIKTLNEYMNNIDFDEFESFFKLLQTATGKIYIVGNGGSASTASHMANDFAIGLKVRGFKPFDIVSLCDNSAVSFAISNDTTFDNVFYLQLKDILEKDDVLIAISCSGNSPNIVKAVDYAKTIGATVVGLSGFDGGYLKQVADIKLHIESKKGEYGLVEDAHLILNHILFSYFSKGL